MKYVRFRDPAGAVRRGEYENGTVRFANESYDLESDEIDVLPPSDPSKVVCIGKNYAKHAAELDSEVPDRPLLFLKPPNALAAHGVTVCGHGVVDLDETGQARPHFAFADRLGADYVTVNYPPERDDITEELIDLGEEFDLDVAIHNYSSVHHDDLSTVFSSIDDVRGVLDQFDHPRLGTCMDTGHFLVEDVAPDDVIRELGDRINSVHLKDTSDAEEEDLPGAGRLDLPHLLGLLDEHADVDAPLVIEYELPDERATAALQEAEQNIRDGLAER